MFNFAIMGAGGIAERFCKAIKFTDCARVIAVGSKSEERAKNFAKRNSVAEYYGDYETMLTECKLDGVYVATTNNFHFENIMLCLKHNIPVLCEKPMVMTEKEAKEVFETADKKGVLVMEAMWSHLLPCNKLAKELISKGEIGDVVSAEYAFGFDAGEGHRVFDPKIGGGALYDVGVYAIEGLMDLINKPVDDVMPSIVFNKNGIDLTDHVVLRFGNCIADAHSSILSDLINDAVVYGTKGRIYLKNAFACKEFIMTKKDGTEEKYNIDFKDGFEYEIEEFVRCVKEGLTESPYVTHNETLCCARIFDICINK